MHHKFSPSSMPRLIQCPASYKLQKLIRAKYPDTDSPAAALGTAAHKLIEKCLEQNKRPEDFDEINGHTVDQNMIDAVQVMLDYVSLLKASYSDLEIYSEQKVTANSIDGVWGTADIIAYSPSKRKLFVVDYKHGQGVYVDVSDNYQHHTYAIATLDTFKHIRPETVYEVVVQPRHRSGEPIRTEEFSVDDLRDKRKTILAAIEKAKSPEYLDHVNPGPYCTFCLALAPPTASLRCPALDDTAEDIMNANLPEITFEDFDDLSNNDDDEFKTVERLYKAIPALEARIKQIKVWMLEQVSSGKSDRYYIRQKGGKTEFKDPEVAQKTITDHLLKKGLTEDDIFDTIFTVSQPRLRTPKQLQKLLEDLNGFEELYEQSITPVIEVRNETNS